MAKTIWPIVTEFQQKYSLHMDNNKKESGKFKLMAII